MVDESLDSVAKRMQESRSGTAKAGISQPATEKSFRQDLQSSAINDESFGIKVLDI